MKELNFVVLAIIIVIVISVGAIFGIDREMARRDYNKNVDECMPIDGCVFSTNCNHYNKMIEISCE